MSMKEILVCVAAFLCADMTVIGVVGAVAAVCVYCGG